MEVEALEPRNATDIAEAKVVAAVGERIALGQGMVLSRSPGLRETSVAPERPSRATLHNVLVRPRPLRDQVYDRLRAMILSGEIAPASPLIELDIAARFGASRTPVREALRRLEAEGMLEPRGARGTVVRELKPDEVFCILEIREALETIAALRASRRMQPGDFSQLEALVAAMRHSVDDLREMERLDTAFHDEILAHAEGIRLKRMLGDLRSDILPLRPFALATLERRQAVVEEHASMLAAIQNHDEEAITRATHRHIVNTRTAIVHGANALGTNISRTNISRTNISRTNMSGTNISGSQVDVSRA